MRWKEVFFAGPAGRLQGVHELPESAPRFAAAVCHPHPLHGGALVNGIVVRVARALRAAGAATLRFNFRGVGQSEGEHDGVGGAEGDLRAALDYLAREHEGLELWAGGYSFGALAAGGLGARDASIECLVLVALPVEIYDCAFVAKLRQPALALFGGADGYGTLAALRRRQPELPPRFDAREIDGADHFFRGRTPLVEAAVLDFARRVQDPDAPAARGA